MDVLFLLDAPDVEELQGMSDAGAVKGHHIPWLFRVLDGILPSYVGIVA